MSKQTHNKTRVQQVHRSFLYRGNILVKISASYVSARVFFAFGVHQFFLWCAPIFFVVCTRLKARSLRQQDIVPPQVGADQNRQKEEGTDSPRTQRM